MEITSWLSRAYEKSFDCHGRSIEVVTESKNADDKQHGISKVTRCILCVQASIGIVAQRCYRQSIPPRSNITDSISDWLVQVHDRRVIHCVHSEGASMTSIDDRSKLAEYRALVHVACRALRLSSSPADDLDLLQATGMDGTHILIITHASRDDVPL